jgi:type III secretion system low calcium response chaperone LcrH/SycD
MEKLDDFKISIDNLSKIFDTTNIKKANKKNSGLIQETFGISDAVLTRYYQVATHLIEEKKWDDARDAFLFLTFLNSMVHNFWIGLGAVEQSTHNYEKALSVYMMAELIDPENPVAYANSFQCSIAIGEIDYAERCWKKAFDCCGDKPEWVELKGKLIQLHNPDKKK